MNERLRNQTAINDIMRQEKRTQDRELRELQQSMEDLKHDKQEKERLLAEMTASKLRLQHQYSKLLSDYEADAELLRIERIRSGQFNANLQMCDSGMRICQGFSKPLLNSQNRFCTTLLTMIRKAMLNDRIQL